MEMLVSKSEDSLEECEFSVPLQQGWTEGLNKKSGKIGLHKNTDIDMFEGKNSVDSLHDRKSTLSLNSSRRKSSLFANTGRDLSCLLDEERFTNIYYDPNALWIFPLKSRFRRFCIKISESTYFEYFIILLILSNCAFLACDRPKPYKDCGNFSSAAREKIFLGFYVFEMIIKIIALGFYLGKNAYLSDPWNRLDFFIVITGLISWTSGADSFGIFRVFRILRPLRLLTNMQGMRNLVSGFFESIPLLLNTLALLFFIFLMWGLFGLNMFGSGRFRHFCQSKELANLYLYQDAGGCNSKFQYLKYGTLQTSQYEQVTFGHCLQHTSGSYYTLVKENGTNSVMFSMHADSSCEDDSIWENRCDLNFCCLGKHGSPANDSRNLYIGGEYGLSEANEWHFTMKMPICQKKDESIDCSAADECKEDQECCDTGHSAYLNFVSFDNLPKAILVIFQVLTLEDWWKVLSATLPSAPYDTWQKCWELIFIFAFYISLVVFGSFFVLNLTIVAIKAKLLTKEENETRKSFRGGVIRKSIYHRERETEFTQWVNEIIRTNWFNRLFMVLIILNTIVLGSYHYGISEGLEDFLDYTNLVLTILFVIEMIVKIIGLSLMGYLEDKFNIFDGAVAIFAFIEMIVLLSIDNADGVGLSAFRLLRLFRLFRVVRVVKLVRYFETLQRIIWVIACSLESIMNIAMLLFLFIFSFALMGMTLFGQSFEEPYPPNTDRTTFENFLSAWMAVFQVLTLEGWVDVMRNTVRQTSWWSCTFFIAWIVIGVYCLLNMFLAIVLQRFEQDQKRQLEKRLEEKRNQKETDLSPRMLKRSNLSMILASNTKISDSMIIDLEGQYQWRLWCACRKKLPLVADSDTIEEVQMDVPIDPSPSKELEVPLDSDKARSSNSSVNSNNSSASRKIKLKPLRGIKKLKAVVKSDAFKCVKRFETLHRKKTFQAAASIIVDQHSVKSQEEVKQDILIPEDHILVDYEYYEVVAKFVFGKWFQTFIAVVIALSTIALALEHEGASEKFQDVLLKLDITFFTFFLVEALLKIALMGFMGRPNAYLSDSWNVLDFFVVFTSCFTLTKNSSPYFKPFRALRAFRPLRLLSRNEGMRVVTRALFRSMPAMINVLAVTMLVWLIFAICGVELLNGRMRECYNSETNNPWGEFTQDEYSAYFLAHGMSFQTPYSACGECGNDASKFCAIQNVDNLPTDRQICNWLTNAEWKVYPYNFDNVGNAMLTLFVVSTLEGWVDIMYHAVDSRTVLDCRPYEGTNRFMALYFMMFIIIGSFFFVSLFVGVVFDNFVKLRDEEMGLGLLSDVQKNWVQTQMMVLKAKPLIVPLPPGPKKVQPLLFTGNDSRRSSRRSTKLRKEESWRMPFYRLTLHPNFEKGIMVCIVLNVMVMCFDSYPIKSWKKTMLKIIDIVFTAVFTIEMGIKLIGLGPWQYLSDNWNKFDGFIVIGAWIGVALEDNAKDLSMLPMLRILRLFRVSRLIRLVKSMHRLKTLLRTLIISLPSLANVGTLLVLMYSVSAIFFMNMLAGIEANGDCINDNNNFKNFPRAISTLFVVSTGDNWQCIMEEACHGSGLCFMSFLTFYLMVTLVTLNLLIAIIIDNFEIVAVEDAKQVRCDDVKLTEEMVANFSDAWAILDPAATKFIPHTNFCDLLMLVDPPLGVGRNGSRVDVIKIRNQVNIPVHDNARIHYGEVLFALADFHCGAILPSDTMIYNKLMRQLTRKLPKYGEEGQIELSTMLAVMKCQRLWRAKVLKRRLARVKMRFTSKDLQREHVKKELDVIFEEEQARKIEIQKSKIAMKDDLEKSPKKQVFVTKPESSMPPQSPVRNNGWFEDSPRKPTGKITQNGEDSPQENRFGEIEGEIIELQHLNKDIQKLHSNQNSQQPSQIIINAPIYINHYAQADHHPPGTYVQVRPDKRKTSKSKNQSNKIPPHEFKI